MEGIRLTLSRSYWIMQRTPDTFPSFINDIGQSMMEYVSELTRERVRYRGNGYAPSLDLTAPNGSQDAFYIKIDKHYGSSDHVTYMQHGIPAVMFITWPDMWYHSSQDTPDKQDPTQYKRAAIVGTGALAVIATGGEELAGRVTTENLGRGTERMGDSERKGVNYMADAHDAGSAARGMEGRAHLDPAPGGRREGRHRVGGGAVPGSGRRGQASGVTAGRRGHVRARRCWRRRGPPTRSRRSG